MNKTALGGIVLKLNKVQTAAYELLQSDARFLYTLTDIQHNASNINGNYIMMCQPYIGVFTDGAEQWCKKMRLGAPTFNEEEKTYYSALRLRHKLFEKSYGDYMQLLTDKLNESDKYFYSIRSFREKICGYYNVGVDICAGNFCGNTILGAMYSPVSLLGNQNIGIWIKNISMISGRLAAFLECSKFPPYTYDSHFVIKPKDYHFFENCPLKGKTNLDFLLFSVLCCVNYVTVFIDKCFTEEIPQKFKFAYLQYYYLCDFLKEINAINNKNFHLNNSLYDRNFRNCLAHYGLGQFLKETEIIENDVLKGLTYKAFNLDYFSAKEQLYNSLRCLTEQIEGTILNFIG